MHHTTDQDAIARSVFRGLVPNPAAEPPKDRGRMSRGMLTTGSVLLAGSVAAMSLNLSGPIAPVQAKQPMKPKGSTAERGATVREAMAASAAITPVAATEIAQAPSAPTTYVVAEGDTISSIAGAFGLSTASVLARNGLGWSSLIFPGQQLTLADAGSVEPETTAPAASPDGTYTIAGGDTMSAIADRFGISTLSLLTANGLGWQSIIYPGQTITIPGVAVTGADLAEPAAAEAPAPELEVEPVVEVAPIEDAPAETPASSYAIQTGDTVGSIAAAFGLTTEELLDANGLDLASVIYSGHTLTIPGPGVAIAAAVSSGGDSSNGLSDEMRANATVIVQVGRELGISDFGIVIALATAMQESSLRNLDWGDLDSVGLFQQRPSAGWGSVEQLTTPDYAARLFYGGETNPNAGYTRGLLDISGWESMSLTDAAQRVQISAYPDAYAKWESAAWEWLAELA
jgi:LysM repeat protein